MQFMDTLLTILSTEIHIHKIVLTNKWFHYFSTTYF